MDIIPAEKPDVDEFLRVQLRIARGKDRPLQIRVVPQVYTADTKQYVGWPSIAWAITVDTLDEAKGLKRTFDEFFDALGRLGLQRMVEVLKTAEVERSESHG